MLLTGQRFASLARFSNLLKLNFIGKDTYSKVIDYYAKPIICHKWASNRKKEIEKIKQKGEQICLSGDARFDSRGKGSAKYGIYTMIDSSTNKILDFSIKQKGEEPGELESKAFLVCMLRHVAELGLDLIKAFCSDRNYTVGKKMKDFFPTIYHGFDVSFSNTSN
jgi:hypothetical protein